MGRYHNQAFYIQREPNQKEGAATTLFSVLCNNLKGLEYLLTKQGVKEEIVPSDEGTTALLNTALLNEFLSGAPQTILSGQFLYAVCSGNTPTDQGHKEWLRAMRKTERKLQPYGFSLLGNVYGGPDFLVPGEY